MRLLNLRFAAVVDCILMKSAFSHCSIQLSENDKSINMNGSMETKFSEEK